MAPRPETDRNEAAGLKINLPSYSETHDPKGDNCQQPKDNGKIDMQAPRVLVPPDGGWGWMVLLGAMIINIVTIGHGKSFGVYFNKLIVEFDSSPSRVAWLFSLQVSAYSFLSPVISVLAQVVGPRKVALGGGFLAFLSLTASSFVTSLEYLYLFFGVVQGIAVTCTFTPGIMMIAKYFNHRRGLANGLTMASNAIGGMIMPLVTSKLISEYSLRGCFLIMASILLNACVGAMLWQPVEWHQKETPIEGIPMLEENCAGKCSRSNESVGKDTLCPQEDSKNPSILEDNKTLTKDNMFIENFESGLDLSLDNATSLKEPEVFVDRKNSRYLSGPNLYSNIEGKGKIFRGGSSSHLDDISKRNERTYGSSVSTESLPNKFRLAPTLLNHHSKTSSFIYLSSYSFGPTVGAVLTKEHFTSQEGNDFKGEMDDSEKTKKHKKIFFSSCLRMLNINKSIFEKSRFYIMTITLFFHALGYQGTYTFLPYRATTLGLSEGHVASLLSVMAFTDLIGRISGAWLSDFNLCPRKYWFIGGMFMSSVFAFSLPLYQSYIALLLGSACFGFFSGAYIGLIVVLFADAYCPNEVALAYSISAVAGGFMSLGGPPSMGYVLETTGSYGICQSVLACAQLGGAAIWLAEPWALRYEKRRQELKSQMKSSEEQHLV
ncbi:hypothetical protein JTE90_024293 [Oedothorax gibbosus]|uniref:Major facilitator superfamily (MFS) profile domain-containing protein n=1 Tax=Oedothorax gibbosus TaxID=931172 RepID=A0AAV6VXN0_9ARAC|nr:hypothetical protein JTE90_024293 [Oedothorax gibbosus]